MNTIENNIESARQHILQSWAGKNLLDLAVDTYYPQFINRPRLRASCKAKILKNSGWLGNLLERDCFNKSPDNKASRDLNCSELKTMQLKLNPSGKSFGFRSLTITQANRNDLIDKEFDEHQALQSKFLDMLVVFCHNHYLIGVGVIQPDHDMVDRARFDYEDLADYADSCGSDYVFHSQGWKTTKDSVLTLSKKKTSNGERRKQIAFNSPIIKRCFNEDSVFV